MSDAPHHSLSSGGARAAPGWFPDPSSGPFERWWDGLSWTVHTRPYPQAPPGRPVEVRNAPATIGLVLGVVALVANTFLLVSFAALVFSVLGLGRAGQLAGAGHGPVGRGRALVGIVLSLLGGAATVLFKALLL